MEFKGKVLIIGYGSVSKCTLPVLFKHLKVPFSQVTIIDFIETDQSLKHWTDKGVKFCREEITPRNMSRLLEQHVSKGGLIIDLSWNIDTIDMLRWCHENDVLYVNTSLEEWDPYADLRKRTPYEKSLYCRQMELRAETAKWGGKSATAVIDHGANPGLISHFVKKGLEDIAMKSLKDKEVPEKDKKQTEKLLTEKDFARLAMQLGIKVIHCSERDTQITSRPKEVDEFVGTWSIEGMREEAVSPAEMGWGTHEDEPSLPASRPETGPGNQIFLSQMGMNTWVRSWIPHQEIVGMVIRHGEAFTISEHLSVWKNKQCIYRPTVHYAYMPCHETLSSLHELRCRNYRLQPKQRIMRDEITSGEDILGALLMGGRYTSWWTGSILSIEEARRLAPHQNATTVQVAIGVVAAVLWMLENPRKGVCVPDDLPHDYILRIAKPYLGRLLSIPSDWTPFSNYEVMFRENPQQYLNKKNKWSFENFLFRS
jgi:homospermidine synthase